MATEKVTITLDREQLERVRHLVASGKASSVSGFVKHAVEVSLQDVAGWGTLLADALRQTGGPVTKQERSWADRILAPKVRAKGKRRRKAA